MVSDDKARPARQIYIALPAAVADALLAASVREDRPGKLQAVRYIVSGLRREGYLPEAAPGDPPLVGPKS